MSKTRGKPATSSMGVNAGSGYAAYLAARIEREENAATAEQVRRNAARRELAWLRRGAPARSTKPKARVDSAKALIAQRADAPARQGDLGLDLGTTRLGSKGVEFSGVTYSWPGTTTLGLSASNASKLASQVLVLLTGCRPSMRSV